RPKPSTRGRYMRRAKRWPSSIERSSGRSPSSVSVPSIFLLFPCASRLLCAQVAARDPSPCHEISKGARGETGGIQCRLGGCGGEHRRGLGFPDRQMEQRSKHAQRRVGPPHPVVAAARLERLAAEIRAEE